MRISASASLRRVWVWLRHPWIRVAWHLGKPIVKKNGKFRVARKSEIGIAKPTPTDITRAERAANPQPPLSTPSPSNQNE